MIPTPSHYPARSYPRHGATGILTGRQESLREGLMARIDRVEVHVFTYDVPDLELPAHGAAGVANLIARAGGRLPCTRYAVRVGSDDGATGEYVTHWVGTPSSLG